MHALVKGYKLQKLRQGAQEQYIRAKLLREMFVFNVAAPIPIRSDQGGDCTAAGQQVSGWMSTYLNLGISQCPLALSMAMG